MITIFNTFFVCKAVNYIFFFTFKTLNNPNMIVETPNTIEIRARVVCCSSIASNVKQKVVTIVITKRYVFRLLFFFCAITFIFIQ